jgi:hypothetical protein
MPVPGAHERRAVTVKNRSLSSPAELFIDDARKLAAGFSKQA